MQILTRKVKSLLRPFIPTRIRREVVKRLSRHTRYTCGSPAEMFGAIYRDGIWGSSNDFMSGEGSRERSVVEHYVAAVQEFAEALSKPIAAVDLGCGDFFRWDQTGTILQLVPGLRRRSGVGRT